MKNTTFLWFNTALCGIHYSFVLESSKSKSLKTHLYCYYLMENWEERSKTQLDHQVGSTDFVLRKTPLVKIKLKIANFFLVVISSMWFTVAFARQQSVAIVTCSNTFHPQNNLQIDRPIH